MSSIIRRERQAFLSQIVITVFLVYCLWQRICLPTAYYVGVIILSIIVSGLIVKVSRYSTIALFLVYLFTRNIYYISSQYKIHPFFDSWWSYGVVKIISALGVVPVFESGESFLTNMLSLPSEFPFLPIETSILSQISGISTLTTSLIMVQIMLTIIFISVYLLLKKLSQTLDLDKRFAGVALLIYVATPETLFWFSMFKYEVLAISFFSLFLYLHFVQSINASMTPNAHNLITGILLIGIVLSHHFVSIITTLYLFILSIFYYIGYTLRSLRAPFKISRSLYLGTFLIGIIFIWWNNFTTLILPASVGILHRLINLLRVIGIIKPAFFVSSWYPSSLTPDRFLFLLTLRDVLLYIPVVLGFWYLCFRYLKKRTPPLNFLVLSTLGFGLMASINLITTEIGLMRIIPYAMPFFAFSCASFYFGIAKLFEKNRLLSKGLIVLICMILLFSSFIGLWGHKYVPAHLYDTSISWSKIGEHNPMFQSVKNFLIDHHEEINTFKQIISDDIPMMITILPPEYYVKAMRPYNQPFENSIIFVELNQLNPYSYSEVVALPFYRPEGAWSEIEYYAQQIELNQVVNGQLNCIYSTGSSKIYIR